jgi:hypothetical protein
MTNNKRLPIEIQLVNINDPTDIKNYVSIHAAMRAYKKSYVTIKENIKHNKVIDGYRWELKQPDNREDIHDLLDEITEPDIDIELDYVSTSRYLESIHEESIFEPDPIIRPNPTIRNIYDNVEKESIPKKRDQCLCIIM